MNSIWTALTESVSGITGRCLLRRPGSGHSRCLQFWVLCLAFCQFVTVAKAADFAQFAADVSATVQEPKVKVPFKHSDVIFSSRWKRPLWPGDPHDTARDMLLFHANQLAWVYTTNVAWMRENKQLGHGFSGTLNTFLADSLQSPLRSLGRVRNGKGEMVTAPWMGTNGLYWWGCVNSAEFRATYLAHAKLLIDGGSDWIQMDDPGLNFNTVDWGGCYCDACRKKAEAQHVNFLFGMSNFQKESVRDFYKDIRKELDLYAGHHVMMSANLDYPLPFPAELFDFGLAELAAEHLNLATLVRNYRYFSSRSWSQIYTFRGTNVAMTRKVIATCYGLGGHVIAPWDVWMPYGEPRFFGNPEDTADLYGFVRASSNVLDGYEEAFEILPGVPRDRRNGGGILLVESDSDEVCGFVRVKPKDTNSPVIIHLVDWGSRASSVTVKVSDSYATGMVATLLSPVPYSADVHAEAEKTGNYKDLRRSVRVNGSRNGRFVEFKIPAIDPWGILVLNRKNIGAG